VSHGRDLVQIEPVAELLPGEGGFLTLVRLRWRNLYADGSRSRPYAYEFIHRRGYDAVAIAVYHEEDGAPHVAYRPAIRVPVWSRRELPLCLPDRREYLLIPEAIAGSLEPSDRGLEGFLGRVVAEVLEETGFAVPPKQVEPLGAGFFPSHGQSSEKIHLCAVRVDPSAAGEPTGDGSVNEADSPPLLFRSSRDILLDCARGAIEDPKVEILARRLCVRLGYLPELGRYELPGDGAGPAALRSAQDEGGFAGPRGM
jgi:ADP-ribose pyrophosphatase